MSRNPNKDFYKKLNKTYKSTKPKYSLQRIPDDPTKMPQTQTKQFDKSSHQGLVERLHFNKDREISVVRVALLKDGTFAYEYGNADNAFLYGAGKGLMNEACWNSKDQYNDNSDSDD